jgi:hypothetical protein
MAGPMHVERGGIEQGMASIRFLLLGHRTTSVSIGRLFPLVKVGMCWNCGFSCSL